MHFYLLLMELPAQKHSVNTWHISQVYKEERQIQINKHNVELEKLPKISKTFHVRFCTH